MPPNPASKMAKSLFQKFGRAYSHLRFFPSSSLALSPIIQARDSIFFAPKNFSQVILPNPSWNFRNLSHGSINLVTSQGKLKFETHEVDPPKKEKWKTKKRLKMQRKRTKKIRKEANKRDPRRLGIKGKKKKQRFANAAERIMYKLEKAKIKEGMLIQRLERYEVPKAQGPMVKPHKLTGEERFYFKKMAQKQSNYVPIGRRGVFGGVILNMHMHWKKHETVEVICKPCKPGQVQEYAQEIARLSGGIPIQIIRDDTIIFYRGKNYVQPQVMSPIDTLSKKRALEKSKYEQSLESVQRFIAISEKELELYYRHIALYGDPNDRNLLSVLEDPVKSTKESQTLGIRGEGNNNSDFGSDKAPSEIDENQNLSLGSQSPSRQDHGGVYDFNEQERESLSIGSTCLSGSHLCNGTQKDW